MPYIPQEKRTAIYAKQLTPAGSGELNFAITMTLADYLEKHELSYATINDILGALEGAKLEFYRRVAVPYETEKMKENGDVF
jgi:hypothetical protein